MRRQLHGAVGFLAQWAGGIVTGAIVGSALAPRPYYPYGARPRITDLAAEASGTDSLGTRLLVKK